jgi:hypothetical protein
MAYASARGTRSRQNEDGRRAVVMVAASTFGMRIGARPTDVATGLSWRTQYSVSGEQSCVPTDTVLCAPQHSSLAWQSATQMSSLSGRTANVDRRGSCSRRVPGTGACCAAIADAGTALGCSGFRAGGVSPLCDGECMIGGTRSG